MNRAELKEQIERRWPGNAGCHYPATGLTCEVTCDCAALQELCGRLFLEWEFSFAGLIVEEGAKEWQLRYCFYGDREAGWVHVVVNAPLDRTLFPSIVKFVHAADWHEREAEDLYGLTFEGHPRLGDFVLHDDTWQEGVEPMRRHFDPKSAMLHRKPDADWRPRRIVEEPGAFVMPIGPKYSGVTESVHFLLETVGEDVIRSAPRLFYKWRAIEKLAEGKTAEQVLLLAERFAATTAFAHGLAFCQAVEAICGANVPTRAQASCEYFWLNSNACDNTPVRFRKSANPLPWSSPTVRLEFWRKIYCGFLANLPAIAICLACSRLADCCATYQTMRAGKRLRVAASAQAFERT